MTTRDRLIAHLRARREARDLTAAQRIDLALAACVVFAVIVAAVRGLGAV